MQFFAAIDVFGRAWEFVGRSWADGGFPANRSGEPTASPNRNSLLSWSVVDLDPGDPGHRRVLRDAYAGDGVVGDRGEYLAWLRREAGLDAGQAEAVAEDSRESQTERCPHCGADIPLEVAGQDEPDPDDEAAWADLGLAHEDDCDWVATRGFGAEPAEDAEEE